MDNFYDEIKEKLKKNGYKLTNQRLLVIEVILENSGDHLTSEGIYELVKKEDPAVGLATVYRNLKLFTKIGILTKLNIGDGCSRYEINRSENSHHHHHLICKKCGKIFEVEDDALEILEEEIEKKYDFKVTNHKVKFYGICKECLNKA